MAQTEQNGEIRYLNPPTVEVRKKKYFQHQPKIIWQNIFPLLIREARH